MKSFKRVLKIAGLVIMIILASLGVGLTGAAPVALFKKGRDKKNVTKIELVDENEDQQEAEDIKKIG